MDDSGGERERHHGDALDFYASPGVMTDLSSLDDELAEGPDGVPTDPRAVAEMVQGLLIHPHWAAAYDVDVPPPRQAELGVRAAADMLRGVLDRDGRPLAEPREPAARFLGNCRDFSTLAVALLRRAGHPARARCGFAGYFEAGRWVDHWIVEHWQDDRWVVLDAQIDAFQREVAQLAADPADLPPDHFLAAGDAWTRCQAGELDPETFGILDMWGAWFIKSNLGRDLAALNKVEMLPWDDWGVLAQDAENAAEDAVATEIADLLKTDDLAAIRHRYEDPGLRATSDVESLGPDGVWGRQTVPELLPHP